MSREIKFRAWLKKEKKMVKVKTLHLGTRKIIYGYSENSQCYGNKSCSFDDVRLMQYIGLKDKNGKEIFEGDIVKTNIDLTGIVRFDIGYYFEWITNNLVSMWNKDMKVWVEWGLEIIGNIYENPELLEVE